MTLLGKVLVYLTVALSFVMLAWALALYTHRIDWSNATAKGDHPAGALVSRADRINKTELPAVEVANARWRQALHGKDGLLAWEKRNADDRAWYDVQRKAARSGSDGRGGKEVMKRVATKDGVAILGADGRPTLVDAERPKVGEEQRGGPLYCYDYYVADLKDLTAKIQAQQEAYQKAVKEETELTQLASGPKPVVDERIKAVAKEQNLSPSDIPLRQRILDEQTKLKRATEELADTLSRRTNSVIDTELLLSRRAQLERRVEELKKTQEVKD